MAAHSIVQTDKTALYKIATVLFFLTLSIYFLLSPGRIDTGDTQIRLEGIKGIVSTGYPVIQHVYLDESTTGFMKSKIDGYALVSQYGLGSHLFYLPFYLAIKKITDNLNQEGFWFSQINRVYAALAITIFMLLLVSIGIPIKDAFLHSLLLAFCSQFFVTATSSFHQIPQALCLISIVFFGYLSTKNSNVIPFILMQISLILLILIKSRFIYFTPIFILILFSNFKRVSFTLCLQTLSIIIISILTFKLHEYYKTLYILGPLDLPVSPNYKHQPIVIQSLKQISVVLISPGKGLLFFSPLAIISALGIKKAFSDNKILTTSLTLLVILWLIAVSRTSASGDWCWGPRYLVPILPIIFIFFSYAYSDIKKHHRKFFKFAVTYSFIVQLIGLSYDYFRFFLQKLRPEDVWNIPYFYYKNSQLVYRFKEISLTFKNFNEVNFNGFFSPTSMPEVITYNIIINPTKGGRDGMMSWLLEYPVFWLPRPWPIWNQFTSDINNNLWGISALFIATLCICYSFRILKR